METHGPKPPVIQLLHMMQSPEYATIRSVAGDDCQETISQHGIDLLFKTTRVCGTTSLWKPTLPLTFVSQRFATGMTHGDRKVDRKGEKRKKRKQHLIVKLQSRWWSPSRSLDQLLDARDYLDAIASFSVIFHTILSQTRIPRFQATLVGQILTRDYPYLPSTHLLPQACRLIMYHHPPQGHAELATVSSGRPGLEKRVHVLPLPAWPVLPRLRERQPRRTFCFPEALPLLR